MSIIFHMPPCWAMLALWGLPLWQLPFRDIFGEFYNFFHSQVPKYLWVPKICMASVITQPPNWLHSPPRWNMKNNWHIYIFYTKGTFTYYVHKYALKKSMFYFGFSICTRQESQCLLYAGYFGWLPWDILVNYDETQSCWQVQINLWA
jgi:hypothetical protein